MRDLLEDFVVEHIHEFDIKEPSSKIWSLIEKKLDCVSDDDSLEQFVVANREKFNTQLPDSNLWSKIDQQLSPEPKVRKLNYLKLAGIAASLLLLMLASAAAGIYLYSPNEKPIVTVEPNDLPPQFVELEKAYQKRVNRKHTQLASYNYDSAVNEDLLYVDEILKELRDEIKEAPQGSEEEIINAMTKNYETKLKILERVLERIKATDSKNKNKDEGISM